MLAAWLILVNAPAPAPAPGPSGRPVLDYGVLVTLLGFAVIIAVGGLILTLVNRWRRGLAQEDATGEQMASFRQLYERGQLSQEEYDRIKERLSSRLRQEWSLPAPAGPPRPENPPQPPAPPAAPASEG